jgi:hypothetical protein
MPERLIFFGTAHGIAHIGHHLLEFFIRERTKRPSLWARILSMP